MEELRAQMLQLLIELEEARDMSQKHEESFLEMQGLLEDERLASAHQAEAFTRQIQRLQAQLRSVQEEMVSLEEEKEIELQEAREELRATQEEVLILQQAAEEAAAERENDIASLQEELCRLRAEISQLENTGQEYELEIVTLRAEIEMKSKFRQQQRTEGDVDELKDTCINLKEQCQLLREENTRLTNRLQLLQKRSSSGAYVTLKEEQEEIEEAKDMDCGTETDGAGSYTCMNQMSSNCRLVDAGIQKNISFEGKPITPTSWTGGFSEILSLRDQLKQSEEKAAHMQRECDGLKDELQNLGEMCESSQKERAELELELLRCREELEKHTDGKQA
ncbi:coiled-coil domain-containing protein 136 [Triplophysa dalaica]|uniref:coiled-coil domain-containing protein 136 n=1 Tax=Triplophysa dalaica TaxID=1582913 RepID=UPI0024DFD500|nr:coiled-coil domain-containing protein 136 [Triplophysa dalaica]